MGVVNYTLVDGELLAENRDNVRGWYVPDPFGSPIALLDNTHSKTDTFSYRLYGPLCCVSARLRLSLAV